MQATWDPAEIRIDRVALIVATFSLLTFLSVLVYLVFELAGHAAAQPSLSDNLPGFRAVFPL